ncbi:hypothetical protein [Streptomyces sp. NPDC059489]
MSIPKRIKLGPSVGPRKVWAPKPALLTKMSKLSGFHSSRSVERRVA